MFRPSPLVFLTLLSLGCQTEATGDPESGEPPPEGTVEVTRPNAEGEPIRVHMPQQLAPIIEVQEGMRCGVKDTQGAYLSCRPGTSCVSPAEGAAGRCEAAPRAPRWDG
jgi:hypothetical protein